MPKREQIIELGSIVKYKGDPDTFGIVVMVGSNPDAEWGKDGLNWSKALVQWNNGVRRKDWISNLEVICK